MNTYRFGMGCLLILTGLMCFIGVSVRFGLIGTICVLMTVRLPTYDQLSTYMLVAPTSSVRLVVYELLLTLKLVTLLIIRLFLLVVTELASVVLENIRNALSSFRLTD